MELWNWQQAEFLLRILLAGICGAMIGYERNSRNKEAGIRTHMIVTMGASLIMIISKYGFTDILGNAGIALDPSRIAAQIVTGVGFLGAGMIFVRKNNISGLTTAAGIWATSAVGMAIGCGLYLIGIVTGCLIVLLQIVLHRHYKWLPEPYKDEVSFLIDKDKEAFVDFKRQLEMHQIEIINLKVQEEREGYRLDIVINVTKPLTPNVFLSMFHDCSYVKEIDV